MDASFASRLMRGLGFNVNCVGSVRLSLHFFGGGGRGEWGNHRVHLGQVHLGQVHLGQVHLGQVRLGQVRLR
jgi:hypothetical protein